MDWAEARRSGAWDLNRLTDAELLEITAEAPDAFGIFYKRHVHAILAYVTRQTPDTATALDLTAEVFAGALAASGRYRAERAPARAWLFGIANKKLAASRRRAAIETAARRRMRMSPLEFADEALERAEELIDASAAGYLSGLERLSPSERMAVEARVLDEREYADIARDADSSEAAIRQRVSRGLAKLATLARRD